MERSSLRLSDSADPSLLVFEVPGYLAAGGGGAECFALPLMVREGGVLLTLQTDVLLPDLLVPDELIEATEIVGPSRVFQASLYEEEDDGNVKLVTRNGSVLFCDFLDSKLRFCREYCDRLECLRMDLCRSSHWPFLCTRSLQMQQQNVNFYNAREEQDGPPKTAAAKKATAKRMSNAAISEQLSALAAQVKILAQRQAIPPPMAAVTSPVTAADRAEGQVSLLSGGFKMPAISAGCGATEVVQPGKALALAGPPSRVRTPAASAAIQDELCDPVDPGLDPTAAVLTQQSAAITAWLRIHLQCFSQAGCNQSLHWGGHFPLWCRLNLQQSIWPTSKSSKCCRPGGANCHPGTRRGPAKMQRAKGRPILQAPSGNLGSRGSQGGH